MPWLSTLFMQGEGHNWPPLLSPVIKGQTKKQIFKFWKKTKFEQFVTVIHIYASGRCIFHWIHLKFYEKIFYFWQNLVFLVYCHAVVSGGNGGVKNKNKMLKNALILTGIKYIVQIGILYHKKDYLKYSLKSKIRCQL